MQYYSPCCAPLDRYPQFGPAVAQILIAFAGLSGIFFLLMRVLIRLWHVWQTARQRRLIWAIVHAHLLTLLVLLIGFLILSAFQAWLEGPPALLKSMPQGTAFLFWFSSTVFYLISMAIIALPVMVMVLVLAALSSYLTARPITRRIEALAQAVGLFQEGALPDSVGD